VILYSCGKGKELKDAEQGCIADTLTLRQRSSLTKKLVSCGYKVCWRNVTDVFSAMKWD